MKTRIWTGLTAFLLSIGVVGPGMGQEASPPAAEAGAGEQGPPVVDGPRLWISGSEWDFGEVWQGTPVKGEFTVKNTGTKPLQLDVKTSCGCTTPTRPKSPLQPGEEDKFTISYDTVHKTGPARQTVTINSNDPTRQAAPIAVSGIVKQLYDLEPRNGLSFTQMRSDTRETKTVRIVNKYDGPVQFKLKPGQDFGIFDVQMKEVEPGQVYELTAATQPPLTQSVNQSQVVLETGLEASPEITIPLRAYVQPDVTCNPRVIRVARRSSFPTERALRFTCRADKPVKIMEIRPSHEGITYEVQDPQQLQGSDWVAQTIKLKLPPGEEMPPGNARLTIVTDSEDPQYKEFEITIMMIEPRPTPRNIIDRQGPAQVNPHAQQQSAHPSAIKK